MKTIKEYVQQFTLKEREVLAQEIDYALNYLNRLAVSNQVPCSNRLMKLIQRSDFNNTLPVKMRLTPGDVKNHKGLANEKL